MRVLLSFPLQSLLGDLLWWISWLWQQAPFWRPSKRHEGFPCPRGLQWRASHFVPLAEAHSPGAGINNTAAWPFDLHQRLRTARCTTDEKLPVLPGRWALHYPGQLQGLGTKHPEISVARRISPVPPTSTEERDLKDLNYLETLTKVTGARGKGRSPLAESSIPPASFICALPCWFLPFLHNTCNSIYLLFSLNQLYIDLLLFSPILGNNNHKTGA